MPPVRAVRTARTTPSMPLPTRVASHELPLRSMGARCTPRCDAVERQLKARTVRLVCFGDIHMAFWAIEQLGPVLREADCAILTGDLTHFGDPPDAFRIVNAVRQFCPNVLAVTGNLDFV